MIAKTDQPGTLIFAGGGSGGHIYPGLAIAEQIRRLSDARNQSPPTILFVCSNRPLDASILAASGEQFLPSPARPILLRPRGIFRFLGSWGPAVRQARGLIRSQGGSARSAAVHVVAMGGFVAAPFVQGARVERCPVTLVNLDAVPGKANRWIAPRADCVFSAIQVPAGLRPRARTGNWIDVPPIVRATARATASREQACATLGLDVDCPVLMVTGGSQGLRSLNAFLAAFARSEEGRRALTGDDPRSRWQILHQTGGGEDEFVAHEYRQVGINARVVPFTDQMGLWWSAADLAVCTAGAGTVAEVWGSATPALMLPYPYHRDQHQRYNAAPLQGSGGVVVGIDRIDPQDNVRQNGAELVRLLIDSQRRSTMRHALRQLGPVNGAERVAQALVDSLARRTSSQISVA